MSGVTVTSLDAQGKVLASERIEFDPDPYLPTYEMLLAVRNRINDQLAR